MVVNFISDSIRTVLRDYGYETFVPSQPILITGSSTAYDLVNPEVWTMDINSTATDDGTTVLKPFDRTISEPGRYVLKFKVNTSTNQSVSLTGGSGIQVTGSHPNFTITNTYKPTINYNPGRSLNSNFTPSTSRPVIGIYTITCSATNPLAIGSSTATIVAEYSTNGGSSWIAYNSNGNSNSVGVAVAIQLTNGQTGTLVVPMSENHLVRLRSTTTGTATVSLVANQSSEITL